MIQSSIFIYNMDKKESEKMILYAPIIDPKIPAFIG